MVNLAPAQAAVERLMTDRVRLYRNPGGVEDDTLSSAPGDLSLTPALPSAYYDGKGSVKVSQAASNGTTGSGATAPLAVFPLRDDLLEVVESRDPTLPGRWFRVDEVRGGSFAVFRGMTVSEVSAP